MNKVILIGNLTRDAELAETPSGVSVCKFSLAVNRAYTNGEGERQTDFFNCTAWRAQAESVAKYCKKGSKVAVSGSVQIRSWEDNNGVKHQGVDIIAQDVEFLTPKRDEDGDYSDRRESNRETSSRRPKPTLPTFDDDRDIPF